jgi:hypothetical protein
MNEDLPNLNCDICGKRLTKADFPSHYEEHFEIPRKVNICKSCHSRIHFLPARLGEQYFPKRIKIPQSSLSFFKRLYPNVVAQNGDIIFDGESLFQARYEVVDDKDWKPGLTFEEYFQEITKRIRNGMCNIAKKRAKREMQKLKKKE